MPKQPKIPTMTRGPEPKRLKVDGKWEDAIKKSLEKKKPPDGWPKDAEEGG
jgi:hypothetical protein